MLIARGRGNTDDTVSAKSGGHTTCYICFYKVRIHKSAYENVFLYK